MYHLVANYTTNQLGLKPAKAVAFAGFADVANYTTNQLGLKLISSPILPIFESYELQIIPQTNSV